MASSQVEMEGMARNGIQLKRLGFLRTLTINVVVLLSNIYDHAKQNSGSVKPTVNKAESVVATVVIPIYQRFKDVPIHLLVFLDNKVDEASHKFDDRAPPMAKKAALTAHLLVKKASTTVEELADEAKVGGPLAVMSRASTISKNFVVNRLAVVWYKINQNPTLHGVSESAVPTATHWSEKYNGLVQDMRGKGYSLFYYAPCIPIEEMAKAYKQVETSAGKEDEASCSSESESDKE